MWETSKLPKEYVENLNMAEVVVVPGEWNRQVFRASGVTRPIHVCNLGADLSNFQQVDPPSFGPLIFGCAGRLSHGGERKGVNEVIRLFLKTFKDTTDVRLNVKCFQDDPLDKSLIDDPRISVEQRYLSDRQFANWISGVHVFVSLAKGEGWGMIQHQAMVIGRPVITPLWGGVSEFMDPSICMPVEHTLEEPPKGNFYHGHGHWASPSEVMASHAMISCQIHRDQLQPLGLMAAAAARKLNHHAANRALWKVLKKYGAL